MAGAARPLPPPQPLGNAGGGGGRAGPFNGRGEAGAVLSRSGPTRSFSRTRTASAPARSRPARRSPHPVRSGVCSERAWGSPGLETGFRGRGGVVVGSLCGFNLVALSLGVELRGDLSIMISYRW